MKQSEEVGRVLSKFASGFLSDLRYERWIDGKQLKSRGLGLDAAIRFYSPTHDIHFLAVKESGGWRQCTGAEYAALVELL